MKISKQSLLILFALSLVYSTAIAQIERGDPNSRKVGIHRGNQVRTVFSNWGVIAQPGDQGPRAAWKFDTNGYVGDVSPVVGVRLPVKYYTREDNGVIDTLADITDTLHSVIVTPVSRPGGGDYAPGGGAFWGFEPISGFSNAEINEIGKGVAMSHQPETWPPYWPDQPTWLDDDGNAEWNGFFGRGQFNADQESYFWMDDNPDEKMYTRYNFLPDSIDDSRRGQALRMKVRGLQWANFLAQDVVFWLYEIENVGTTLYEQTVFGALVGTYVGAEGDEWNDDVSFFAVRDDITYSWDFDGNIRKSANPRWQPNPDEVGYIAYAFLESPGNSFDGIDNDFDNANFSTSAPLFSEDDFLPRVLDAGDEIVLISRNGSNYHRTLFTIPNDTVQVVSLDKSFTIIPGVTEVVEGNLVAGNFGNQTVNLNAYDGLDNDFDGLVDENSQIHYRQLKVADNGTVLIDTLNPVQYIDYLNGATSAKMIDEGRNDNVDNDGDWSTDPETGLPIFDENNNLVDDVGADGKANTGDTGEYDGIPTNGEPNFDRTDINESDQIGLTSFQYFVPAGDITMSDEEDMWARLKPGAFDVPSSIINNVAIRGEDGDFLYGSGYFPLLPGATERFSLALAFGDDFPAVLKTKRIAQFIYDANYNFPQPPEKPTITAVAGDGKVTLYWDDVAENSIDPTLKIKDFEGYKIYKGTDPDFTDAFTITDGTGTARQYDPIAQFDLDNDINGYFNMTPALYDLTSGVPFFLGNNNGIVNSFVDEDVTNGRTYYYAVVAYDRGKEDSDIYPSENTKFIAEDAGGNLQLDINTVAVTPVAPVAGYVPPEGGQPLERVSGSSKVFPFYEVVDETKVKSTQYEVTFVDSAVNQVDYAYAYNVVNLSTNDTVVNKNAKIVAENGTIFDGISLSIDPSYQTADSVKINISETGWRTDSALRMLRTAVSRINIGNFRGVKDPKDYNIIFYDNYDKQSVNRMLGLPLPSKKTNFEVFDVSGATPIPVPYGVVLADSQITRGSRIFLAKTDTSVLTWSIDFLGDSSKVPDFGDTLHLSFNKPITSADKFVFTTESAGFSSADAGDKIDEIRVVPNPYVVSNVFEKPLPPQWRGRGERIVKFINLPPESEINIYTSAGVHIRNLFHDGSIFNGTVEWDLRTKEGLDIAYGVYFYIVEAPSISEKKYGKIAIIK